MKDETRAEKLLEALNDTPDDMVIAAAPDNKSKKRGVPLLAKIGSAAAAVIAVGGIATAVLLNRSPNGLVQSGQSATSEAEATTNSSAPEQVSQPEGTSSQDASVPDNNSSQPEQSQQGTLTADENLPKITAALSHGAMGFEGIMVPDISDYASGNPWCEEQNITVMPVYKNRVMKDQGLSVLTDIDCEELVAEMKSVLIENAALLGVELSEADIEDNLPSPEEREIMAQGYYAAWRKEPPKGYFTPQNVNYETDKYKISTDNDFCTTINFKEPVSLPVNPHSADIDEVREAAAYLTTEYSDLLKNMENPTISIDGGDYSYSGERTWFGISVYDAAGIIEQHIENYFMKYVRFYCDDNNDLYIIRIFRNDLAGELVGNYPLLTTEEAAEMLKNGEFATSVPVSEGYKPESYGRVELVYRTGITDEYFIPYYKFWVDVTEEIGAEGWSSGEVAKTYGAFYIPAVRPEYLEDTPTYDGRFN